MLDLKDEVLAAQRRLLIKFLDYYYTGEDPAELIWQASYLTNYVKPSFANAADNRLCEFPSNQQSAPEDFPSRHLRDFVDVL